MDAAALTLMVNFSSLALVRRQISRDDSSLPSFRARLSQATRLSAPVVQRGRTCSDVSLRGDTPATDDLSPETVLAVRPPASAAYRAAI